MTEYGTLKVFHYFLVHGQGRIRIVMTERYVTLEAAKNLFTIFKRENPNLDIHAKWYPEHTNL